MESMSQHLEDSPSACFIGNAQEGSFREIQLGVGFCRDYRLVWRLYFVSDNLPQKLYVITRLSKT